MEDNLVVMQMEDTTNFYQMEDGLKFLVNNLIFSSSNEMNIRCDCFVNKMVPNQSTRYQTQAIGIV